MSLDTHEAAVAAGFSKHEKAQPAESVGLSPDGSKGPAWSLGNPIIPPSWQSLKSIPCAGQVLGGNWPGDQVFQSAAPE